MEMTSTSLQLPNLGLVKTQKGVTVMPPVYVWKTGQERAIIPGLNADATMDSDAERQTAGSAARPNNTAARPNNTAARHDLQDSSGH